jgi:hypothetical protein
MESTMKTLVRKGFGPFHWEPLKGLASPSPPFSPTLFVPFPSPFLCRSQALRFFDSSATIFLD